MRGRSDSPQLSVGFVTQLLEPAYGLSLDPNALAALALEILPYLRRSQLPLRAATDKIAHHYLQDSARVRRLTDDPNGPEWQAVLTQVLSFAARHALYPDDSDATTWPDLDAYGDIQRKLSSYNFEGSLDSWVTVTILNRLRRFWRDRQALSAGGLGFYRSRPLDDAASAGPRGARTMSLEQLVDQEVLTAGPLRSDYRSVGHDVEDAELRRVVFGAVRAYALEKQDVQLVHIWHAVVEQQFKLREASDYFGLTISQIHRRLEQVRAYLRQDAHVSLWFELGD